MRIIYSKGNLIKKNKKFLEKELNVKIEINDKITIEGDLLDEYLTEKIIEAINFGFSLETAMLIKKEDFLFEKINLKNYTKKKDFRRIRGRIIGKGGKALRILQDLTKCFFEINDNEVGIIGPPENIQNAQEAIISLIRGAKHSNVYFFLEKHKPKEIYDFGIKKKK